MFVFTKLGKVTRLCKKSSRIASFLARLLLATIKLRAVTKDFSPHDRRKTLHLCIPTIITNRQLSISRRPQATPFIHVCTRVREPLCVGTRTHTFYFFFLIRTRKTQETFMLIKLFSKINYINKVGRELFSNFATKITKTHLL